MDRLAPILLPWARLAPLALSLCCLSALAADPVGLEDTGQPGLRPVTSQFRAFSNPLRWRLLSNHSFAPSLGLRATGGLLGPLGTDTSVRLGTTQRRATPYVGLGYSTGGVSANRWGGWALSADIGLQALPSSEWTLGRALESPAGVGELLRELRLTPVLQLGVSYAF